MEWLHQEVIEKYWCVLRILPYYIDHLCKPILGLAQTKIYTETFRIQASVRFTKAALAPSCTVYTLSRCPYIHC